MHFHILTLNAHSSALSQELNEEGASGTRDHDLEHLIKDSTGAVVDRRDAIQKTRLSLCHCLYLSCLISPPSTFLTKFFFFFCSNG